MDQGTADVLVQFNPNTKKVLFCSTYQMMVLLLFNYQSTWTFGDMLQATGIYQISPNVYSQLLIINYLKKGIPNKDLEAAVLSMAHPKIKVMRKAPNTKDIADSHKFQINPKYTNPRARIPIPTLELARPKLEEVNPALTTLRRHQLDEAIICEMKVNKTLKHDELVTRIVKRLQARFTPKTMHIKKRIANLIDLEYLERDQNDRQLYHYKQ